MKKRQGITLIFGILLLCGGSIRSQEAIQVLDIGAGYEQDGYLIRFGYSRIYTKHMFTAAGQLHMDNYTIGVVRPQSLHTRLYLLNLEYHYELFNHNARNWVGYLGGGGILGYEDIEAIMLTPGNTLDQDSDFIYGGQVGITIEKYIGSLSPTTDLSVWLNARQNYWLNSAFGNHQFNIAAGLRFLF